MVRWSVRYIETTIMTAIEDHEDGVGKEMMMKKEEKVKRVDDAILVGCIATSISRQRRK